MSFSILLLHNSRPKPFVSDFEDPEAGPEVITGVTTSLFCLRFDVNLFLSRYLPRLFSYERKSQLKRSNSPLDCTKNDLILLSHSKCNSSKTPSNTSAEHSYVWGPLIDPLPSCNLMKVLDSWFNFDVFAHGQVGNIVLCKRAPRKKLLRETSYCRKVIQPFDLYKPNKTLPLVQSYFINARRLRHTVGTTLALF